jgi:exopolysaccharide biosynthesis polyprenyl glycosylphosphotransferase
MAHHLFVINVKVFVMDGIKRQLIIELLKLFDITVTGVALVLAILIANLNFSYSEFTRLLSMRFSIQNIIALLVFGLSAHFIYKQMGFYDSRRLSHVAAEIWDIVKGVAVVSMALFFMQIIYPMRIINMSALQFFWLICTCVFIGDRMIFRLFLIWSRQKGRNLRNVVIVGSNARAMKYAHKFATHLSYGYHVLGFVDNDFFGKDKHAELPWCKLVANFTTFPEYLRKTVVDEVFIFLPFKSKYSTIASIVAASEEQGIVVRLGLDFFNLQIAQGKIETIEDESLLTLYTGAMRRRMILIKGCIDRVCAALLLLLCLPLFMVTALAIKVMSPGPVFFKQIRIGRNKRRFEIYKFRTMIPDAESKLKDLEGLNEMGQNAGAFKLKNDPRVTPLGKFLRKTSIDELPQLINVLKGDMSIVGPRPLTERDYDKFQLHSQVRRFSVKPGMTCLWQISGRNHTAFDKWMSLDMQYIDEWSMGLDMKILLKTIPAVFTGHGAV